MLCSDVLEQVKAVVLGRVASFPDQQDTAICEAPPRQEVENFRELVPIQEQGANERQQQLQRPVPGEGRFRANGDEDLTLRPREAPILDSHGDPFALRSVGTLRAIRANVAETRTDSWVSGHFEV